MNLRKYILSAAAAATVLAPVKAQEPIAVASTQAATDTDTVSTACNPQAQASIMTQINTPGSTVTVEVPQNLASRLENHTTSQQQANETEPSQTADESSTAHQERPVQISRGKIVGYRIQIYTDQNARTGKSEARNRERAINRSFPQYTTYLTYSSPYWRLRIGDFKTQEEATKAAANIRRTFPRYSRDVRIVRDRINAR